MMGSVFARGVEWISPYIRTLKDAKVGNLNMRTRILASFVAKLLQALRACLQIELIDDRTGKLSKVIAIHPQEQAA